MTRAPEKPATNSAGPQPRGHPWFPRPARWGATETIIEGVPCGAGDGGTGC